MNFHTLPFQEVTGELDLELKGRDVPFAKEVCVRVLM